MGNLGLFIRVGVNGGSIKPHILRPKFDPGDQRRFLYFWGGAQNGDQNGDENVRENGCDHGDENAQKNDGWNSLQRIAKIVWQTGAEQQIRHAVDRSVLHDSRKFLYPWRVGEYLVYPKTILYLRETKGGAFETYKYV